MNQAQTQTVQFIRQWHKGDSTALDSLLERHLPWIHEKVRQRLTPLFRQKGETGDFVHDILLQFLKFSPRFVISDENQFRVLLLRVVENALHDKYDWFMAKRREIARERPLPSDTVLYFQSMQDQVKTPSQDVDQHEKEAWVRIGMELLDPGDREILVLRQWKDLSFPDIGKRLGTSSNTARMRYNRAVLRLTDKVLALRRGDLASAL